MMRTERTARDTVLDTRPPPMVRLRERSAWQRVWFALQAAPWRTLALVPGDDDVATIEIANLLALIGRSVDEPIGVADVRRVTPRSTSAALDLVAWHVSLGKRIILATRPVDHNIATVPLVQGADQAVLCATLRGTSLSSIEEAVRLIGKDRFLGSVLVGPRGAADPGRPVVEASSLLGRLVRGNA